MADDITERRSQDPDSDFRRVVIVELDRLHHGLILRYLGLVVGLLTAGAMFFVTQQRIGITAKQDAKNLATQIQVERHRVALEQCLDLNRRNGAVKLEAEKLFPGRSLTATFKLVDTGWPYNPHCARAAERIAPLPLHAHP